MESNRYSAVLTEYVFVYLLIFPGNSEMSLNIIQAVITFLAQYC